MDDREVYELRQLCTTAGLAQDALGSLMDANLSVPVLVRSEAAAMAQAKQAGLNMAERQKLRDALRRHKEEVLSSVEPRIIDIGEDMEAHHIVAAQQQLAAERAKARQLKNEEKKGEEVVKNGRILERYRWTQELNELTVSVELPPGTSKKEVVCKIGPHTLSAGLRGEPPMVDGTFWKPIKAEGGMWQLQDSHRLIITFPKLSLEREEWWPCLLKGEPEINTNDCTSGEATNLFCNTGERRLRIQQIDVGQYRDPTKKYSPEEAEKAWKDFFTKFPDWHAYEITLNANATKTDGTPMTEEENLVDTLQKSFGSSIGEWEKSTD